MGRKHQVQHTPDITAQNLLGPFMAKIEAISPVQTQFKPTLAVFYYSELT
jgi:hypothetical protein